MPIFVKKKKKADFVKMLVVVIDVLKCLDFNTDFIKFINLLTFRLTQVK